MKSSDQILLEQAYDSVSTYKSPWEGSPYGKKDTAANQIFKELSEVFEKLSPDSDVYEYEKDGDTYRLTKMVDDKGYVSFYWGRLWKGQVWGREISEHSTSFVKDNQRLLDYLKTL
mgnify:FL=1